jgi:endonuclease/exonuclease/phosphatase family metal-dependent hydrolase
VASSATSAPAIRVLSWNVFHGRDAPPDPKLFTWRSRLLKTSERNATHVQVNRPLLAEFADLIAASAWTVCLLQEAPPSWAERLAERCGAEAHLVRTSRNQLAPLRTRLGRWNPDLLGSWEGGSNLTLVRGPWRIGARRSELLNPFPRRGLRERRRMGLTGLSGPNVDICVANLHATAGDRTRAEEDVRRGARLAVELAEGRPLLFGGDLNLRPRSSTIFEELERRYGLAAPTAPDAIDHLLARGLEVLERPRRCAPERRELPAGERDPGLCLRLSDHAPVAAEFAPLLDSDRVR